MAYFSRKKFFSKFFFEKQIFFAQYYVKSFNITLRMYLKLSKLDGNCKKVKTKILAIDQNLVVENHSKIPQIHGESRFFSIFDPLVSF